MDDFDSFDDLGSGSDNDGDVDGVDCVPVDLIPTYVSIFEEKEGGKETFKKKQMEKEPKTAKQIAKEEFEEKRQAEKELERARKKEREKIFNFLRHEDAYFEAVRKKGIFFDPEAGDCGWHAFRRRMGSILGKEIPTDIDDVEVMRRFVSKLKPKRFLTDDWEVFPLAAKEYFNANKIILFGDAFNSNIFDTNHGAVRFIKGSNLKNLGGINLDLTQYENNKREIKIWLHSDGSVKRVHDCSSKTDLPNRWNRVR